MTFTTTIRINWPVPAVNLLDVATLAAGGDPPTVVRDEEHPSSIWNMSWVRNRPDQGLAAYLHVRWTEQLDKGFESEPAPPALVILTIDTPYVDSAGQTGHQAAATILRPIQDWLDDHNVPRTSWWWEDEQKGSFHPGSTDVAALADPALPRENWTSSPS